MLNRTLIIVFTLIASAMGCFGAVIIFQETERSAITIALGMVIGLVLSLYIEKANIRLLSTTSPTDEQANRWLILAAVGGVVLARIALRSLDQTTQDMLNGFLFALIGVFAVYATFWAWRHLDANYSKDPYLVSGIELNRLKT